MPHIDFLNLKRVYSQVKTEARVVLWVPLLFFVGVIINFSYVGLAGVSF